jgi:hypothetical protein
MNAASAGFRDEKVASGSVFEGLALVGASQGTIPLVNGNASTPPGSLLMVALSDLCVQSLSTVVLVENGAIARHWAECRLPDGLDSALMVYRGHSRDGRAVKDWLEELPPHITQIGFFDFDPAGLDLSAGYRLHGILIPDQRDNLPLSSSANKPDAHVAQMAAQPTLFERLSSPIRGLLRWMTAEHRRCAVTQEWLLANQWPLALLPLPP